MQPQTRVRRMRPRGRHHGRSTDGIRQTYYDEQIRAATAGHPVMIYTYDEDGNLTGAYLDHGEDTAS